MPSRSAGNSILQTPSLTLYALYASAPPLLLLLLQEAVRLPTLRRSSWVMMRTMMTQGVRLMRRRLRRRLYQLLCLARLLALRRPQPMQGGNHSLEHLSASSAGVWSEWQQSRRCSLGSWTGARV